MTNKFITFLKENWIGGIVGFAIFFILAKLNILTSDIFTQVLGTTFCGNGGWFRCLGRDVFLSVSVPPLMGAFIQSKLKRK
jgi:hypothetical protein